LNVFSLTLFVNWQDSGIAWCSLLVSVERKLLSINVIVDAYLVLYIMLCYFFLFVILMLFSSLLVWLFKWVACNLKVIYKTYKQLYHQVFFITCTHAASRYCFWRCLSVCVSVCTKSRKLLIRNWCNLLGICPMVNARSDLKSVTFDLESYFRIFSFAIHISYII